jgi:hypothetical protein
VERCLGEGKLRTPSTLVFLTRNFRDLLVRHERLIHQIELNKGANNTPRSHLDSPTMVGHGSFTNRLDPNLLHREAQNDGIRLHHMTAQISENLIPQRPSGYSLDLLSDAAHHLASDRYNSDLLSRSLEVAKQEPILSEPNHQVLSYHAGPEEDTAMKNTDPNLSHTDHFEDYNLFLDDSGLNSNFFSAFDTNIPVSFWSKPSMTESSGQFDDSRLSTHESQDERNSFSRFGSRLPSLQPEQREGSSFDGRKTPEDSSMNGPPWRVSPRDHRVIQSKLEDFSSVLPSGFSLPLRRTLSRYLEGYISGFHEHMPCLHIPTLVPVNLAPELLLALVAIGAQYRFESYRGNRLWYAARAVSLEQLRRRNSQQVMDIISPPATHRPETPGQTPQPLRNPETRTAIDMAAITGGSNSNSMYVGSVCCCFLWDMYPRCSVLEVSRAHLYLTPLILFRHLSSHLIE